MKRLGDGIEAQWLTFMVLREVGNGCCSPIFVDTLAVVLIMLYTEQVVEMSAESDE